MLLSTLKNWNQLTPAQILASGYFTVIVIGTILLMLPIATPDGQGLGFINSLFTATSATCVTGLIVVNTSTAFTVFGQVVILVLIQIGGLGLMTMSTLAALILGKKIGLRSRLIILEDLNQMNISGIVRLVSYVLGFTLIIQGAGALLLFLRLVSDYSVLDALYKAIFHAISAFNNAGFDIFGNSLESFTGDIAVNFIIIGLIVLGGIGFGVLVEMYNKRKLNQLSLQSKIVLITTVILLIAGFVGIFILEYSNMATMGQLNLGETALASFFLSVTPRTAGFNTVPTGGLTPPALFFVIILMFIGASPGSTGGGIKTTTFGVMLITVWNMLRGREDLEIANRRLKREVVLKAISIAMLAAGLIILVTIVLSVIEEAEFLDILFETVSAFGTVGLSTGVTPTLSMVGRILIIITMFVGRVGPLTLGTAFAERELRGDYHYPPEEVMVG